jgi:four helix bundle protein
MEPAKTFEDLIVWQKAHQFVLNVYSHTKNFPREELYGLTSQFGRAAISVAGNIAEAFKRGKDKPKFLNISQASLDEAKYYILLSRDLKYGEDVQLKALAEEVSRLLERYRNTIIKSDSALSILLTILPF